MALGGYVTRPSTGQRVHWEAATPVLDDYEEARRRGIRCLGVIGNASHLKKSGQHTPWSGNGWAYGYVHAIDLDISREQWERVAHELRTGRWSTVVRFVNYGGSQYGSTGVRRGSSGDHHLHISYAPGTHKRPGPGLIRSALTAGLGNEPLSASEVNRIVYGVGEGVSPSEWQKKGAAPSLQHLWEVLANVQGAVAAVQTKVEGIETGGVDLDALAGKVVALVAAKLPTPTIDYAALAKAVNDDHAKRMQG